MSQDSPELRLGDWRAVLADVEQVDAVICDPPYSERIEKGQRSGKRERGGFDMPAVISDTSRIGYGSLSREDVAALVEHWAPRVHRWFVMFGDHYTVPWALESLELAGLYTFAPVVWVKTNPAPRFVADGPASGVEYIAIARPRGPHVKRSRPGHYYGAGGAAFPSAVVTGGKPEWLMRAVVRDYSEPGDLIVDPFGGGASTLRAAVIEGRRAIGAEIDPDTHAKAVERLAQPYTPCVQFDRLEGEQGALFGEVGT